MGAPAHALRERIRWDRRSRSRVRTNRSRLSSRTRSARRTTVARWRAVPASIPNKRCPRRLGPPLAGVAPASAARSPAELAGLPHAYRALRSCSSSEFVGNSSRLGARRRLPWDALLLRCRRTHRPGYAPSSGTDIEPAMRLRSAAARRVLPAKRKFGLEGRALPSEPTTDGD